MKNNDTEKELTYLWTCVLSSMIMQMLPEKKENSPLLLKVFRLTVMLIVGLMNLWVVIDILKKYLKPKKK